MMPPNDDFKSPAEFYAVIRRQETAGNEANSALRDDYTILYQGYRATKTQLESTSRDRDAIKIKRDRLQASLESTETANTDLNNRNVELQQELKTAGKRVGELHQEWTTSKKSNEGLGARVTDLTNKKDRADQYVSVTLMLLCVALMILAASWITHNGALAIVAIAINVGYMLVIRKYRDITLIVEYPTESNQVESSQAKTSTLWRVWVPINLVTTIASGVTLRLIENIL